MYVCIYIYREREKERERERERERQRSGIAVGKGLNVKGAPPLEIPMRGFPFRMKSFENAEYLKTIDMICQRISFEKESPHPPRASLTSVGVGQLDLVRLGLHPVFKS